MYLKKWILFAVCGFLICGIKGAEKNTTLKNGREVSVPAIGFQFNSFKDCEQQPIPAANAYEVSRSDGTKHMALENPLENWLRDQCELYLNGGGATIYVAVPKYPVPTAQDIPVIWKENPAVLKNDYDAWKARDFKQEDLDLNTWLETFAGGKIEEDTETRLRAASSTTKIRRFRLKDAKYTSIKHLFFFSDPKYPNSGIAVLYLLDNSLENSKKLERVLLSSVASVRLSVPKGKKEIETKRTASGKSSGTVKRSEKYEESRKRVIGNIKNLPDWWYLETSDYIISSNLKKRREIDRIQTAADLARKAYTLTVPMLHDIDDVSVIRVFENRDDYLVYVGEELKWSIGVWMPDKQEMVVSPVPGMKGKDRAQEMVRTLYHELFHQYIFYAVGNQNVDEWFNEGMAQVFEDLEQKAGGREFAIESKKHLMEMGRTVLGSKYGEIEKIINMEHEEFVEERKISYPAVHALMYFLTRGAHVMKNGADYTEIPGKYYKALVETRNRKKANEIAWEGIDMKKINKDFKEFWNSKTLFNRSKNVPLKPMLTLPEKDAPEQKQTTR